MIRRTTAVEVDQSDRRARYAPVRMPNNARHCLPTTIAEPGGAPCQSRIERGSGPPDLRLRKPLLYPLSYGADLGTPLAVYPRATSLPNTRARLCLLTTTGSSVMARSRRQWGSVRSPASGRYQARYHPDTHRMTPAPQTSATKARRRQMAGFETDRARCGYRC